ncbi:hypothetical protein ACO0LO_09020 [Undibacterium sp. TJN25]|uniref:hypothetical protein n=1 Tax=Undibacterium sp. TJN25 TaxID=3413056 RepID=UPI003BF3273E
MNFKILANFLLLSGVLIVATAIYWWAQFFQPILMQVGMNLSEARSCIYSTGEPCGISHSVARILGKAPYSPYFFWAGVACFAAGIVLRTVKSK